MKACTTHITKKAADTVRMIHHTIPAALKSILLLLELDANIVLAEHNGLIHQRSQSISKFDHYIKSTIRISSGLDRL